MITVLVRKAIISVTQLMGFRVMITHITLLIFYL